jgi:hypothetical protein
VRAGVTGSIVVVKNPWGLLSLCTRPVHLALSGFSKPPYPPLDEFILAPQVNRCEWPHHLMSMIYRQ